MKKILLLLSFTIVTAQLNYLGEINPLVMMRTSDQSQINLPFRLLSVDVGYSMGAMDIITVSSIEHRYENSESIFDLREIYLAYYPDWGEVRIGKQIHAWGAVDGNNPTDNLNPYDYYYMFLPGSDLKIGVLSVSVKYYSDCWNLEAIIIPQHTGNRIPFDEPDFPLSQSTANLDPRDYLEDIDNPLEFGVRWQVNLDYADFSISAFEGRERAFSVLATTSNSNGNVINLFPTPQFGYRKTRMLGLDGVTFYRGITFRGEAAFFKTWNDFSGDYGLALQTEAEYIQYVLQVEFSPIYDITVSTQLLGNKILSVDGKTYFPYVLTELNEDNFSPGMGNPLAMLVDQGLMFSLSRSFMDDQLELSGNTFYNLDMNSFMLGGKFEYSLGESWTVHLGLTQFYGNENEPEDPFNDLESFSHVQISLKYNF